MGNRRASVKMFGRLPVTCILLAAVYTLAGKLGLALAFVNPSTTAVWPPTGIALAAVLVFGPRVWPGILLGAFVTNAMTAGTPATSLLIAIGNTLEALVGGYLVQRFAGGRSAFDQARTIFAFVLLGGLVSAIVSATIGVTTLSIFGLENWSGYWATWLTWWLGDASGATVFAPALLLWHARPRVTWSRREWLEVSCLVVAIVSVGWIVFRVSGYPLEFLCIPLCIWAACRFGQREAATATCLLSLIAVWGSMHGAGVFGTRSMNDVLVRLQLFMAVTSIVGLTTGAAVSGQRVAENNLKRANAELESRVNERTRGLMAAVDRLRISDARFNEAQRVANVGSWEWTLADGSEWWSDELYRICGFEPNSFSPTFEFFLHLLHPDDLEMVSAFVKRASEDRRPFEFEHRIIRPDGAVRTLNARGRVVLDDNDNVARMVGTAQDISQRKLAEEVVERSERRLQTIIDAEPACVKLVSHDGVLLSMNRAGLGMIGATSVAEIVGRPAVDLVHPDDRSKFLQLHHQACGGSPGTGEFRIIALSGEELWVESHLTAFDPSPDDRETKTAVLSVTSDVTERKRLEDQLRQAQKMEAIGLLAGGIAHDFNNLLTAIGGYTEMVMEALDERDPRRADLQEVANAARQASAMTRQLLAFSRRQILQSIVLDVNQLVAETEKLLRRTIPENIDVALELNPALHAVRGDRGQLEQVILNLSINARDAMPQGGRLRITTDNTHVDAALARRYPPMPAGQYVRLTVSDSGVGMAPETRARIFEPFFTTKARGEGTGLGLATVYGIVKQSRGFIWVDSEIGRGTTFEVYLPIVHEPVTPVVEIPRVADIQGGTQTILLAEDDDAVRRLARDVLVSKGYTVLDAADGDEALVIARQYPGAIDLLVTDVVMPTLSGPDLATRLTIERPQVRVLYTSGYAEHVTMSTRFENGLTLLAKPFLPRDLLTKVRELIQPGN